MAEKRIKGITIEIGGDTKKLGEALKGVNKQISDINVELKDLNKALKLDPKNTELLTQKQTLLKEQIKATTDRLNTLKEAQNQMKANGIDDTNEDYRALSIEISRAESSLKELNNELKKTSSFDLNKLNDSLSGVRETTEKLVKSMAKVGVAIGGALSALGVSSIKAYADYEQLVGGVEKIFGESSKELIKYAQQGFKTAGISANQYMETATSFSASLIRGLDGDTRKATELTDRAIRDMADNANTFGSSMDEVMSVYKALSKEQYTTLDNLRLGYAGTKTGMKELIRDASKYKDIQKELGITVDESSLSFDNIINAISVMQKHLNISGTTAKEAEHTISGSINQMKASWGNLLVAVSDDNADMSQAVNDFTDSVIVAGKNIVPRIRVAIDGIKQLFNNLVRDVFPKLKREIPELKPLINIFEWFIDHKGLVMTAIKGIIATFAVTKIVDFATKIQNVFNKISAFATGSTLGMLTTAIAGVITVATVLTTVFDRETEAEREARLEMEKHTDSLNDNLDSWNSLQEAQQESLNKSMSEISYYENLYRELQSITDENGKVQTGYEKRASFITSQLSEALGIEIELTDGVIKNNQEIADSIDKILEKKKAEAILNSQTPAYTEAKAKEAEAYQDMIYWQQKYAEEYAHYQQLMDEGHYDLARAYKTHVDEMKQNYDTSLDQYNKYVYTIGQYEGNLEAIHNEEYDKIETRSWEYVKTLEEADNAQIKEIQDTISRAEYNYKYYNDMFEKTGEERWKIQRDNAQRILDSEKDELQKYVGEFNNQKGAMQSAGVNFLQGAVDGLNSKKSSVFNAITNIGRGMLDRFKSSLKEQSPSKATREMGEFLIEGLSIGIKDNEKSLLNQVDELGNSVIGGLMGNAQIAMQGLNGSIHSSLNPTINPSVAYDLNYQLMANAMKEALQEVDVELDDRQVGKFVNKVVSEEVFN